MRLVCDFCGKEFESNRKKRFCKKQCQLSKHKQCKACGNEYICRRQGRSQYCSRKCHQRQKRKKCYVCLWCASVFTIKTPSSRNKGKYCSRECRFHYLAWRTEVRKVQTEGDLWATGQNARRCCRSCGCEFISENGRSYCSETWVTHQGESRIRVCSNWKRDCSCGRKCDKFKSLCSECYSKRVRARRKAGKIKRKRILKSTQVENIVADEIFARDKWKCQSCKRKVSKQFDVIDDLYPNLDHIIPLSKGGTHTKDNVQCLCRACNLEKSDIVLTLF